MTEYINIKDNMLNCFKGNTPKYVVKSNTLVLNQKCIRNNVIDFSLAQYTEDKCTNENKILRLGDLIINSTGQGTAGRCAYVSELPNTKVTVDSHMLIVRFNNKDLSKFFSYFLYKNEELMLTLLTGSSGQGEFDKERAFNIKFPYCNENKEIFCKIFDAIADKIQLNNKINAELENMAKTLYDYWFVQFDFPDENKRPYKSANGKMVYNEVLKREIPDGWEVKPLKYLIKHINTGLNPRDNFILGNGNIKYITVKNITENNLLDFKNCDTIDEIARNKVHNRSDIQVGDILFASITPLGRCYLIQESPIGWDINESVFSIRPNLIEISSEYLLMCLTSKYFTKKASNSSTGSIFTGIRIKTLENMSILIPPQNILKTFTKKLNQLLKRKNICFKENIDLEKVRDFLLPLLMNGQITVNPEC